MERDLGVVVDTKLSMGEQCSAPARKANKTLGCISKGITSRDSDVPLLIIPLCTCQATPGTLCSVLVPAILFKRGVDRLEDAQRTTTRTIRGLESLPYEERLRELGGFVQPAEKEAQGRDHHYVPALKG